MKYFIILMSFLYLNPAIAQEQTGHGGDPIGIEVSAIVTDILTQAQLEPHFESFLDKHTLEEFIDAIKDIPIKPVKKAMLDGREVAILNFSNPIRMEVGRKAWKKMNTYAVRKHMVLHEILGATDEEPSETYTKTNAILPWISCGVDISELSLSGSALRSFKDILSGAGYLPIRVSSDYKAVSSGNILWLKSASGKTVWSGDWIQNKGSENEFPSSAYIPRCGPIE